EVVLWRPDPFGPVGEVDGVRGVRYAGAGLCAEQEPQRPRPPAGLFLGFPGCGRRGILAGLDLSDRDLPALRPGNEPVPPQQQRLAVTDDDAARAGRRPDQPVLEVPPVGQLDVSET